MRIALPFRFVLVFKSPLTVKRDGIRCQTCGSPSRRAAAHPTDHRCLECSQDWAWSRASVDERRAARGLSPIYKDADKVFVVAEGFARVKILDESQRA